jgi:hypothetical protein
MEKWDSYSVVIEDVGMFPLSYSFCGSNMMIVDVESEKFEVVETWVRYCHPGKWREVMDHFVAGCRLNTYENDGRMRIEKLSGYVYRVTMEKKIRNVERACVECKHYLGCWDLFKGPKAMCRRLQSEECDLICGGTQFVGPMVECKVERELVERSMWKRLWIGSDICGKEGKYWVEK